MSTYELPNEVVAAEHALTTAGFKSIGAMRHYWTKDPTNEHRVSQTDYARQTGVTRQAVSQSLKAYEEANPTVESAPNVSPIGGHNRKVRADKGGTHAKAGEVKADGVPTKATLKRHLNDLLNMGNHVASEFQVLAPTMTTAQLAKALAQFSAVADVLREAVTAPEFVKVEGVDEAVLAA